MRLFEGLSAGLRHMLRNLLRRDRVERELADEIDGYVDLLIEEKVAHGMSRDEARRAAQLEIGRVDQVKEHVRDVRVGAWLDALRQDVRVAVRMLIRRPGFATIAVLTFGVGMGATTAVYSLIDSVLLKPLPFHEPDRLTMVWEVRPRYNSIRSEASPLNYLDWQQQVQAFESLAAYAGGFVTLTGAGTPERLFAVQVTPNLFPTVGVAPLLGPGFAAPDGAPGQSAVAILSYGLWQRRFGADRGIVGQTIRLDGQPHLVVGVMPRDFQFPRQDVQLWTPVDFRAGSGTQSRAGVYLSVVGRLKPDVSLERANTELDAVSRALAQTYPELVGAKAFAVPLQQDLVRNARTSFLLLLAAAALVLLIACANVAGLLVTRGAERDREFAVRTALGGSRIQLLRQLIVEGVLLSVGGAAVGLLLAAQTFDLLETLVPDSLRGAVAPTLDLRLLTVALVAVLFTGIVFGLVPLRHALRTDRRAPLTARTASASTGRRRAQAALVAAEIALAVVVLFSTALMIRTILNLQAVDPGFHVDNVLTMSVALSAADYPNPERQNAFYREVLDRVGRLPGVVSAGFTTFLPYTLFWPAGPVIVEGRPDPADGSNMAIFRYVTPDYLRTLGVPVVGGRGFSDRDTGMPAVALVSERVAALFDGDPVGQRITFGFGPSSMTVVGIVGDIKGEGLDVPNTRGTVYLPAAQLEQIGVFSPRALAVRTTSDPTALAAAVQREIWSINPSQAISSVQPLETVVEGQVSDRKVQTWLLTAFAGLALFMAALGVYGLLSFVVTSRMRELGVRTAMGAQRRDLVSLVGRESALWVSCGFVGGLALAMIVGRSMRTLIYGVEPLDWVSLATSWAVLATAAGLAALLPVWRATRVDPMTVLRAE
ncbi:MAG TPA: ABC transporter permease [Vicinamibacterales bacterium]|nr:ABC transporter permease [Vicinamibacterales bacterium]